MQLGDVDLQKAMHKRPVVDYAQNRIMHMCDMRIAGIALHGLSLPILKRGQQASMHIFMCSTLANCVLLRYALKRHRL